MSPGIRRILAIVLLGALPVVIAVAMFAAASSIRLPGRGLPQRALPRGGAAARLGEPVPGPDHPLEDGKNLVWPPVAAFLVSPLSFLSARRGRLGDRDPRARRCAALAPHRRRPRLARVRRVRAVAARDRRDPGVAPDAVPLRSRRPRLALPRRPVRPRARRRARRRREVLPLAARRLARRDRARPERCSSPPPSPAPRSSSSSRSRGSTTTSAPCSSSETRSTRTATRRSASSCRSARRSGSRAP